MFVSLITILSALVEGHFSAVDCGRVLTTIGLIEQAIIAIKDDTYTSLLANLMGYLTINAYPDPYRSCLISPICQDVPGPGPAWTRSGESSWRPCSRQTTGAGRPPRGELRASPGWSATPAAAPSVTGVRPTSASRPRGRPRHLGRSGGTAGGTRGQPREMEEAGGARGRLRTRCSRPRSRRGSSRDAASPGGAEGGRAGGRGRGGGAERSRAGEEGGRGASADG
jgi:hypothetical protein